MSFLYPDNQHRYDRVTGLASNIGSIQQEVADAIRRQDETNERINTTFNKLLPKYGLHSVAELQEKVTKNFTPEQKAQYEAVVNQVKGHNKVVDTILDASLMVGFISGLTIISAPRIIRLIDTGALLAGFMLIGRGFILLITGNTALGTQFMRAGLRTARLLYTQNPLRPFAVRLVEAFKAGARILAAVSVALDLVVLIYQAVEGAKQRTQLKEGIKELWARRFTVKTLEDQLFAVESFQGEISGYLFTADTLDIGSMTDDVLDKFSNKIIVNVENALSKITNESVAKELKDQDHRTGAWTDEDPTLEEALKFIAEQPDVA